MEGPTPRPARGRDLDIFAAALFLVAASLFLGGPLFTLLRVSEGSLVSTIASASALPALWAAFVIVPALALFVLIGLPCLLASLVRSGPRRRASLGPLLAMTAAALSAGLGSRLSAVWGALGLVATMLAALANTGELLASHGRPTARSLLLLGALAMAGLAAYELPVAAGRESSIALAPTLMTVSAFCLQTGLLLTLARCLLEASAARTCAGIAGLLGLWSMSLIFAWPGPALEAWLTLATASAVGLLAFYGLRPPAISARP